MKQITLLGLALIVMFSSCVVSYNGRGYSNCPTNDKTYFYKRMGVKAPKSFKRWGN
jgi:RecB family endonuclease NucS